MGAKNQIPVGVMSNAQVAKRSNKNARTSGSDEPGACSAGSLGLPPCSELTIVGLLPSREFFAARDSCRDAGRDGLFKAPGFQRCDTSRRRAARRGHSAPQLFRGRFALFERHPPGAGDGLHVAQAEIQPVDGSQQIRDQTAEFQFDLAVDIRKTSPTFGHWVGGILSAENFRQMWVPPGFAHGFLVLADETEFLYKTTGYYAPEHERTIQWDDPDLAIDWPIDGFEPRLSDKDQHGVSFAKAQHFS